MWSPVTILTLTCPVYDCKSPPLSECPNLISYIGPSTPYITGSSSPNVERYIKSSSTKALKSSDSWSNSNHLSNSSF